MDDLLLEYKAWVEEICESTLRPYIDRIQGLSTSSFGYKDINDAVWNTITLKPFEVIILDSPLMQRLRHVTQLGVVHWVYPSASHTRFEHSLGSVAVMQRLIDSINRLAEKQQEDDDIGRLYLGLQWANTLRLAALCHDVGHGCMSHVSEHAIENTEICDDLCLAIQKDPETAGCKLSEVASYTIVGSPAFRELVDIGKEKTQHRLRPDPCTIVQKMIAGKKIDDQLIYLHELISGPYDVDKLDYTARDAHATGVPRIVDVPRLVEKVVMAEVTKDALPRELRELIHPDKPIYHVNAVALSGARTVDELMVGRALLHDKVYRHQKVRCIESAVGLIIDDIGVLMGRRLALLPLLLGDGELLQFDRHVLSDRLSVDIDDSQWAQLARAAALAEKLRERRLFVRAYAFAKTMPRDPFALYSEQSTGWQSLLNELKSLEVRRRIHTAIVHQVSRALDLVPDLAPEGTNAETLPYLVALDPPALQTDTGVIARAKLLTPNGQIVSFGDDYAGTSRIADAYLNPRDIGYIFADRELSRFVYLAAELFLRTEYGIRTPPSAMYYAKMDDARVHDLRVRLTASGFYDGFASDLRAEPEPLRRADAETRIGDVVTNLGTFEGLSPN